MFRTAPVDEDDSSYEFDECSFYTETDDEVTTKDFLMQRTLTLARFTVADRGNQAAKPLSGLSALGHWK